MMEGAVRKLKKRRIRKFLAKIPGKVKTLARKIFGRNSDEVS